MGREHGWSRAVARALWTCFQAEDTAQGQSQVPSGPGLISAWEQRWAVQTGVVSAACCLGPQAFNSYPPPPPELGELTRNTAHVKCFLNESKRTVCSPEVARQDTCRGSPAGSSEPFPTADTLRPHPSRPLTSSATFQTFVASRAAGSCCGARGHRSQGATFLHIIRSVTCCSQRPPLPSATFRSSGGSSPNQTASLSALKM